MTFLLWPKKLRANAESLRNDGRLNMAAVKSINRALYVSMGITLTVIAMVIIGPYGIALGLLAIGIAWIGVYIDFRFSFLRRFIEPYVYGECQKIKVQNVLLRGAFQRITTISCVTSDGKRIKIGPLRGTVYVEKDLPSEGQDIDAFVNGNQAMPDISYIKSRYSLRAFGCVCLLLMAPQQARADQYDQYVQVQCHSEFSKFNVEFFSINKGYVEFTPLDKLVNHGIYFLPPPYQTQKIDCALPVRDMDGKIQETLPLSLTFGYDAHKRYCNHEMDNVRYQLYAGSKLIAADSFNFNCAYLQNASDTPIYSLSAILWGAADKSSRPTLMLEACGFILDNAYSCKKLEVKEGEFLTLSSLRNLN